MPFTKGKGYNSNWDNELPEKIQKKAMKFRLRMIFIFVVVLILAVLLGGCVTKGGKKLTGVVPTGHGTYRLQSAVDREKREAAEKKKVEEAKREALLESIKSQQIKLPPARSKPTTIEPQSVKANEAPIKVAPADSRTPFTPTITEAKLSPAEALIEDLKKVGREENKIVINGEEKNREVKSKITINWIKLTGFYLASAALFAIIYIGFKMTRAKTKRVAKKEPSKKKRATKKS